MKVGRPCNREVVVIEAGAFIREAAKLMRHDYVGGVIVTETRPESSPSSLD
jgi:predicted transcriptional regulator